MMILVNTAKGQNKIDKTFCALGTINNIRVFNSESEDSVDEAIDRVNEIDNRMSAFKPESDISKLSDNAGRGFQQIHQDTYQLIQNALEFGDLSKGSFDITIRPLVELWGINKKGDFVPSDSEIQNALSLVNHHDVILDKKTFGASLKNPGQSLDLGGIAKGYAANEVKRILLSNMVWSALINLGGNIITIGKRPDGRYWQIGIQNPLLPTGKYIGVLSVENKAVVTSGCNEQFFIKQGVRYHHILDPRTGKPVQNSLLSVTIICKDSVAADALSTALFILGPENGIPLLKRMKAEAVFVYNDLSVIVTSGLKKNFVLL